MTHRPLALAAWRTAPYDAVIVGGGPSGLSAALVLGRANKRVLVVDNDRPANAVSQGVGGLLGHDRVKPAQLRRDGRPSSTTSTRLRARPSTSAALRPAGPPPTISAS